MIWSAQAYETGSQEDRLMWLLQISLGPLTKNLHGISDSIGSNVAHKVSSFILSHSAGDVYATVLYDFVCMHVSAGIVQLMSLVYVYLKVDLSR